MSGPRDPEGSPETGGAQAPSPDEWPQVDRRRGGGGGTFWSWIRQTARLWGFLAFVALILVVFRAVILPFVLALLVAYVLAPVIRWISSLHVGGWRVPRFVSIIVVYAVLLGLMGLFFVAFVPRLSTDIKRIVAEAPAFWKQAREQYVPQAAAWIQLNFGEEAAAEQPSSRAARGAPPSTLRLERGPDGQLELDVSRLRVEVTRSEEGRWLVSVPRERAPTATEGLAESITQRLKGLVSQSENRTQQLLGLGQKFVRGVLSAITTFILVLMISAFLLVDTGRILGWFRNLVPPRFYQDFDNVIELIDRGLSGAIRGQALICLVNGVLTYIGLRLIGVKYPLLLGMLAGVMSLIPIFGSILSSIPIVLVALASGSEGVSAIRGVLILAWIIGIHLLEANLLNPKIMGTAAKIHPVVVIFAVVAGEQTYGAVGALLGVPIVSAVQAVFTYLRRKIRGELEEPGAAQGASSG